MCLKKLQYRHNKITLSSVCSVLKSWHGIYCANNCWQSVKCKNILFKKECTEWRNIWLKTGALSTKASKSNTTGHYNTAPLKEWFTPACSTWCSLIQFILRSFDSIMPLFTCRHFITEYSSVMYGWDCETQLRNWGLLG